jgi:NAD(P)-dependent dehydrogenase (short-subunit alcohol dehydrogenase family)
VQGPVLILGASGGVGSDIARTLDRADGDIRLVLHGRNGGALQTLASGLRKAPGIVTADLAEPHEVASLFAGIRESHGHLAAVVFSISVPVRYRLAHNTAWDEFAAQLNTQLKALHLCCASALPLLAASPGGGRFVVVSSEVALHPPAKTAAYSSAKSAMTTYARVVAQEWIKKNVRVHIVAPGLMRTAMTEHLPEEFIAQLEDAMPERRLTTTGDVAATVEFLLTPAADAMYGQPLLISRGSR